MSQFAFLKAEFAPVDELAREAELGAEANASSNLFASLQHQVFRGKR